MGRYKFFEEQKEDPKFSINEFLSTHSRQRHLDGVFKGWFSRIDSSNPKKTIEEWSKILDQFYKE